MGSHAHQTSLVALTPRPHSTSKPEPAAEEAERRAPACRLLYQRAAVRVLAPFAAHTQEGGRLVHLLGPDWLLDVTHLVASHARVQEPRVASLEGGRVLVGREPGVTAIEVSKDGRVGHTPEVGGVPCPVCTC